MKHLRSNRQNKQILASSKKGLVDTVNSVSRGMLLAIPFFLLLAFWSSLLYAQPSVTQQSDCFTVTVSGAHSTTSCSSNTCGTPSAGCQSDCITVTIKSDQCTGLDPTTFTVSSGVNNECHDVCSPSGDFTSSYDHCSWSTPTTITYNNVNGIQDGHSATFQICHVSDGQTYEIACTNPVQCPGGSSNCRHAIISF
jgi:hypothetical protein